MMADMNLTNPGAPPLERKIIDLINSSETMVFYCRYEAGWPVLYLTDNFEVFGYAPQAFYNGEISYEDLLHPFDLKKLEQAVAEKVALGMDHHSQTVRLKNKQGGYAHIDLRLTFERNADGKVTHLLGKLFDVTEQVEAANREKMLVQVIQQTADLVKVTDKFGKLVFVNQALLDKTGYLESELLGGTPAILKSELNEKDKAKKLWQTILSGKVYKNQIVNRCRDGSTYYEETTISPIFNDEGEIEYFVSTGKDVTGQVEMQQALNELAMKDPLTSLYNRRHLQNAIEAEMKRVNRYGGRFGMIMLDIDHFKRINDEHGHDIGDVTLTQVAVILKSNTRETDYVARWGGEEFLILALDLDLTATKGLAEKLREAIEAAEVPHVGKVTASFGATVYHKSETQAQLIKRVDEALYVAKNQGRNRVEID